MILLVKVHYPEGIDAEYQSNLIHEGFELNKVSRWAGPTEGQGDYRTVEISTDQTEIWLDYP